MVTTTGSLKKCSGQQRSTGFFKPGLILGTNLLTNPLNVTQTPFKGHLQQRKVVNK